MIHLIMPMAGRGSRFKGYGAKPYITIYGKPFFFWATESVRKFNELASLDFVVLKEHNAVELIKQYYPDANVHELDDVTQGAVITCLEGCSTIEDNLPVVFNDCDHMFKSRAFNSEDLSSDGILLTFESEEPKYSFVGKDEKGRVVRTVEKEAISNEAICGCYFFNNVDLFRQSAQLYLNDCKYNEFYMSGVYNILISEGKKVSTIRTDFHVPFGVPEEYEMAKNSPHFKELL